MAEIFGWEFKKKEPKKEENLKAIVPSDSDGAIDILSGAGGHFGQTIQWGNEANSTKNLILSYRDAAASTLEVDSAIDDIANEAIVSDEDEKVVSLNTDQLGDSNKLKKVLVEEFNYITDLLDFSNKGYDIFRKWYVDGTAYFQVLINEKTPKDGILGIRPIDPINIKKVREIEKETGAGANIIKGVKEYYIYQDESLGAAGKGLQLAKESVINVTSGLLDPTRQFTVSHLHKALKAINQLRMMEDSLVVYRLVRAPERRIFYIDTGNLPKGRAEEYVQSIMAKHRNKLTYDGNTGEITNQKQQMHMLEDFWLPRREGGRGTEIDTLGGGENLGQIDDVIYFRTKLHKALNVPSSRMEADNPFSSGRTTEITRDELKFNKFVNRLRRKFSLLFIEALRRQMMLKGHVTEDEWPEIQNALSVSYAQDNNFAEFKEAELLQDRLSMLSDVTDYIGETGYFSKQWVRKNVLRQSDEEIEEIKRQIEEEKKTEPQPEEDSGRY
jgi:hypothetical protein